MGRQAEGDRYIIDWQPGRIIPMQRIQPFPPFVPSKHCNRIRDMNFIIGFGLISEPFASQENPVLVQNLETRA